MNMKLENELNVIIPDKIKNIINGLKYTIDDVGKSNSKVVVFDDYILKISCLSFEIENELKVYKEFKDSLPIPKIIECEYNNEKMFILREKLKGKMLCDDYYMTKPDLLFSLAAQAIKLLWSIDIKKIHLQNTFDTIIAYGKNANNNGLLDIDKANKDIVKDFSNFDEIIHFLEINKPKDDNVLTHGDLCISNIICDGEKIVGFIDLGLMGVSHRYHDLAILYRSIKYNYGGKYGKAYTGFSENKLFNLLNIKRDNNLINYFLLLDELLG